MLIIFAYFFVIQRIQADKDDDKGEFSPEVTCDMPCSVPATPAQPHLGSKTKTSFTIKWAVSSVKTCTLHYFILLLDENVAGIANGLLVSVPGPCCSKDG